MNNLPPSLILEILSRLADSSDLTRCRLTCKTLNSLSDDVSAVRLLCSHRLYAHSRAHPTATPFKSLVTRSVTRMTRLDSVSLGVDDSLSGLSFDDVEDEEDDLHLTDHRFVSDWLIHVKDSLKTLSFVDFWVQSCWRRSFVLRLISEHCQKLNELVVKNAWLSMEGVTQIPSLTSLTLEYIRLDDENLLKLNECFPYLQTLNLLGVGGLVDPKICLKHLTSCRWTISNAPLSMTIVASELVMLKLKCVRPQSLVLETPSLLDFHLTLENAGSSIIRDLPHLRKLRLESNYLRSLISSFPCSTAVKELSLDTSNNVKVVDVEGPSLELIYGVFPNVSSLSIGPGAYSDIEACFISLGKLYDRKELTHLEDFTAYLIVRDVEVTLSFISFIIGSCCTLRRVSLLIDSRLDPVTGSALISRCEGLGFRGQWRWGFWERGSEDIRPSFVV